MQRVRCRRRFCFAITADQPRWRLGEQLPQFTHDDLAYDESCDDVEQHWLPRHQLREQKAPRERPVVSKQGPRSEARQNAARRASEGTMDINRMAAPPSWLRRALKFV